MEHVACDLCGSEDHTVIWDKTERDKRGLLRSVVVRDDEGHILNGRTVVCNRCGLAYANPRMSDKELTEFYRSTYRTIYKSNPASEERHAERAYELLWSLKPNLFARFLDVGCSRGLLVDKMSLVCQSYGLEPGYSGGDTRIYSDRLENFAPDEPFDIIAMLNTLEHVPSPSQALDKQRDLMRDDGCLLIAVPRFMGRLINLPVDAFLSNAHLYHFSDDTLEAMLLKNGLRIAQKWVFDEEIGEKLYVLCRKCRPESRLPERPQVETYLQMADAVFAMKSQIAGWGFR